MLLAASDYPLLDLFWTTFFIFGWILWFWLLVRVYSDVFRRHDIGGGMKTVWVIFTLILPIIGVLAYLVSQGRSMQERAVADMQYRQSATDDYIRSVATDASSTQLAKAQGLLDSGVITAAEFDRMVGNSGGGRPAAAPSVPAQAGAPAAESGSRTTTNDTARR
jgi:hypothetical protein